MKLDLFKVVALGILLCHGSPHTKANALYRIVNPSLNTHIRANDDDFVRVFTELITIATQVTVNRQRKESNKGPIGSGVDDEMIEELREAVID